MDHLLVLAEHALSDEKAQRAPPITAGADTVMRDVSAPAHGGLSNDDKGKGKAVDQRRASTSFGSGAVSGQPPAKRARASLAPGAGAPSPSSAPTLAAGSPSALVPGPIPPYRPTAVDTTSASRSASASASASVSPASGAIRPLPPVRESSKHSTPTTATPSEVSVKSKEDLKALMHVRKLLAGMDGAGMSAEAFAERKALLTFMDGGAVVVSSSFRCFAREWLGLTQPHPSSSLRVQQPKLDFMKMEDTRQPWDLPWEDKSKSKEISNGKP